MSVFVGTDIGSYMASESALRPATITAGAGNDNVAVTGTIVDRLAVNNGHVHRSAKLTLQFRAVLAQAETLTVAASLLDAAVSNFASGSATLIALRARYKTDGGTWTAITLVSGAVPTTTIATGPTGGGTVAGMVELDYNLDGARQYLRPTVTTNLSASSTDTSSIGGVLAFGGADEMPA